jgi:hypothetical protein
LIIEVIGAVDDAITVHIVVIVGLIAVVVVVVPCVTVCVTSIAVCAAGMSIGTDGEHQKDKQDGKKQSFETSLHCVTYLAVCVAWYPDNLQAWLMHPELVR